MNIGERAHHAVRRKVFDKVIARGECRDGLPLGSISHIDRGAHRGHMNRSKIEVAYGNSWAVLVAWELA